MRALPTYRGTDIHPYPIDNTVPPAVRLNSASSKAIRENEAWKGLEKPVYHPEIVPASVIEDLLAEHYRNLRISALAEWDMAVAWVVTPDFHRCQKLTSQNPSKCYDLLPLIGGASYRVSYQLGSYPKFTFEKLELSWGVVMSALTSRHR